MKIDECIAMLESVRLMADDGENSISQDAVALNIIHVLIQFIGHPRVEEKINEIPF